MIIIDKPISKSEFVMEHCFIIRRICKKISYGTAPRYGFENKLYTTNLTARFYDFFETCQLTDHDSKTKQNRNLCISGRCIERKKNTISLHSLLYWHWERFIYKGRDDIDSPQEMRRYRMEKSRHCINRCFLIFFFICSVPFCCIF